MLPDKISLVTITGLAAILLLSLSSCDRIKQRGNRVVDRTKTTVAEAKQQIGAAKDRVADKVFPSYDSNRPDTKENRKRFREHLRTEPGSDVQNLYAYGDFLGADYKVLLAFSCDPATIRKIVAANGMQRTTKDDTGLLFPEALPWWDRDLIKKLAPCKAGREGVQWAYLWYDPQSHRAFYEEFSL